MNLSKELAKQAKKFQVCEEWYDKLKTITDKKELIQMYLSGIDFCLNNDYPTNEYIRENFKGEMEQFGVFLDDTIDLKNPRKCVALGKTKGHVACDGFGISEIFVKHDSKMTIVAKDNSFVMVDAFDDSVVHIRAYGKAKVVVNEYGNAKIDYKENDFSRVKMIKKHKKTY